MGELLHPGDTCIAAKDIFAGNELLFSAGETITVAAVTPSQETPEYKYHVYSPRTDKWFLLRDEDLNPIGGSFAGLEPEQAGSVSHKQGNRKGIAVILISLLLFAVLAVAIFFILDLTVFSNKKVPAIVGMSVKSASSGVEKAGLTFKATFKRKTKTGKERAVSQKPKAGIVLKRGEKVTAAFEDPEFESAFLQAAGAVAQANAALQEAQSMGIDTADLVASIQTAQMKLNSASTAEQLVGPTDSAALWANTVINGCAAKKQALMVQQDRARQTANCRSAINSACSRSPYIQHPIGYVNDQGAKMTLQNFTTEENVTTASGTLIYLKNGQGFSDVLAVRCRRSGDTWTVTIYFPDWQETYQWNP